ncbi:hypothetical protein FGADI_12408 [Fusarium gaditjirri]|uniref:Uncharacterized protein n=1 Tax=Fusarium gaditjirri TaxID=282569 RepID=A0A8H4SSH6_9HYPO|nr:hypothetical protein FGADI_12408 [Fusarium gaditjirri]
MVPVGLLFCYRTASASQRKPTYVGIGRFLPNSTALAFFHLFSSPVISSSLLLPSTLISVPSYLNTSSPLLYNYNWHTTTTSINMSHTSNKSLHALSVENKGFQAYPLFWTSQHLEIVGCRFVEVEVTSDLQGRYPQQDGRLTYYATRLATSPVDNMKTHYVRSLFHGTGLLEFVRVAAAFHYAGRLVNVPVCNVFRIAGHILVPHPEPVIGYYSYKADEDRCVRFTPRVGPSGTWNLPIQRLYRRRLARVTPEHWTRDPYLVCVMLSLAQIQWRSDTTQQPRLYLVRLLVTHRDDQLNAYVYKSNFPSQLLECLKSPSRPMSDFVFPSIEVAKVAFEPYETFGGRVVEALIGPQ